MGSLGALLAGGASHMSQPEGQKDWRKTLASGASGAAAGGLAGHMMGQSAAHGALKARTEGMDFVNNMWKQRQDQQSGVMSQMARKLGLV